VTLAANPNRGRRRNGEGTAPFLMMPEPEIWREIALYFLATVFAFTLGIVATVALQLFV
jgi:hypothetical protein